MQRIGQQNPTPTAVAPIPAAATAMDSKLTSGMASHMPRIPRFEGILVGIFNPGTPLAQGVTLTPDNSPGAQPNSFTFNGPYDGNDDGFSETTISGRATFNSDPAIAWSGVTGQVTLDVAIPIVGHVYHADINFSITSAERQLSGTGAFTDPMTGNTTTMTITTPLVIKPATGNPGAVSNACGYNLNGPVQLEVTGPSGTLKSTWNFSSNSATVPANNRTFTDPSGQTTVLPDSAVNAPCAGSGGTINDWAGTSYNQHWACLPRESGQATLTLSVTGPNTVTISDEDPPGSPPSMYTATTIGGNPHALRGFFESGPVGFRYREDFNWTMRRSLSGFAQSSSYEYIEGPNVGTGGLCVASATR
jgi:hypothetical protein